MSNFFSFFTSLFFLFFHPPFPSTTPRPPLPTPTPIIFHQYPASNITVNWGAPGPDFTIFMDNDVKPCDVKESVITVTNNGDKARPLTVRGIKTEELKDFSGILDITIYKDNVLIYGPKKLAVFFTESATASGVSLGSLAAHATSSYKFHIEFPCSAGNEYQEAKLVFNLKIGKSLYVPCPCPCTCYQNQDGRYPIRNCGGSVYADFDEGDHVSCPRTSSCATISP